MRTAAGNRPNIQRTRRGPLALSLVRFRFSHYLGGPFVACFFFDSSRYRLKYRVPLFVCHFGVLASRHGLFSFHCLRFARFRAYIVNTWGRAAGYSFFQGSGRSVRASPLAAVRSSSCLAFPPFLSLSYVHIVADNNVYVYRRLHKIALKMGKVIMYRRIER